MSTEPNIKLRVNAFGDWSKQASSTLAKAGFPAVGDVRDIATAWFNLRRRSVESRPRRTVYSKEFQCPPAFAAPLAALIKDSEGGHSLIKYQSRELAKSATFSDGLLNDWQIQHFHLGSIVESDGFVERTNELLFAIVLPDVLYAVEVGNHHDFSRDELFARITRNWPELVAPRKMPAAEIAQRPISDTERKKLRRAGLYPPTVVGNDAFVPSSGGAVMAGTSLQVIQDVQQLYYFLNTVEAHIEKEASTIIRELREAGHPLGAEVELRIDFEGGVVATYAQGDYSFDVLAGLGR